MSGIGRVVTVPAGQPRSSGGQRTLLILGGALAVIVLYLAGGGMPLGGAPANAGLAVHCVVNADGTIAAAPRQQLQCPVCPAPLPALRPKCPKCPAQEPCAAGGGSAVAAAAEADSCPEVECEACPEVECEACPACSAGSSSAPCAGAFFDGVVAAPAGSFPAPPPWTRGAAGLPGRAGGPAMGGFFQRIRDWGFTPDIILDVGANEGNWARMIWDFFGRVPGRADPTILMIEGSHHRVPALQATGFEFLISVIGEKTRDVEFFSDERAHTGNSVMRENSRHFQQVAPTKVVMRTLDELIAAYRASHPGGASRVNLLKLDVQGYELQALKGAREILKDVEVILLETSVLQYNAGSPLTGEVLSALDELGFQVLDVLELHHGGPQNLLMQIDFSFIRKGSPLINSANAGAGITV
jgi:FkbM family methyltransferase